MKTTLYSLLAAAACGMAFGQTAYTTPVGYTTVPLPGTGGVGTQKIQIANQGLLPGDAVQYAGVAEDITSTYLEDTQGTWAAGAYVTAGSLGTLVSHLVEITSGPLQGTMTWITSSADAGGAGQRLYTSDDISGAGDTAAFRVLKAYTVATLFGNPPSPTVAGGSGLISAADNIQIFNPVGLSTTFWYKNAGGGQGWKGTDIANADVPLTAIHPNDGLIFYRKQVGDGALVITGSVKTTNTEVRIEGGSGLVYNVISTQHASTGATLTIGNSGLYTGDPATGVKGSGLISGADLVQVWNPALNGYLTFWYKNSGGGQGWKAAGSGTLPAVPADYQIPSESALVIVRNAGAAFSWNMQPNYTPPTP